MQQCCWQGSCWAVLKRDRSSHNSGGFAFSQAGLIQSSIPVRDWYLQRAAEHLLFLAGRKATSWSRFQVKSLHELALVYWFRKHRHLQQIYQVGKGKYSLFLICKSCLSLQKTYSEPGFVLQKCFSLWTEQFAWLQSCVQYSPSSPSHVCSSPCCVFCSPHSKLAALWEPGRGMLPPAQALGLQSWVLLPLSKRHGVELSFFHFTGEHRNNIDFIFPQGCLNYSFLLFDRSLFIFNFFDTLLYLPIFSHIGHCVCLVC